jgi:hypothetical protein
MLRKRRNRKFLGTLVMIVFVGIYALAVIGLAQSVLLSGGFWAQMAFYAVAGFAWTLPLMPLITWMERGEP